MQNLFIVFLGPPGVGKGTQAKLIAAAFRIAHISTGDLFRKNLTQQTDLGILAQSYMVKGDLVPDDVTIAMLKDRLCESDCINGAILDGFPRTPNQAAALAILLAALGSEKIITVYINAPDEILINRLSNRLTCSNCKNIFAVSESLNEGSDCPNDCGGILTIRDDDRPETVANRLRVYQEQTATLISYYRDLGVLVEIDGTPNIEDVTEKIFEVLDLTLSNQD